MSKLSISGYPEGVLTDIESALTDINTLLGYCIKIDDAATNGLAGVSNSLAYRVHEIERHFHSYESWFGAAVVPNGEIHVADRIGVGVVAFVLDAGNNTWGNWVQILGSSDTPARVGDVKFDLHRILVTNTERNATYFLQIASGTSGAAGLAAGTYSEAVFQPTSNQIDSGPVDVQERRADVGVKFWARCMCPGQDTGTFSFYHGSHAYPG